MQLEDCQGSVVGRLRQSSPARTGGDFPPALGELRVTALDQYRLQTANVQSLPSIFTFPIGLLEEADVPDLLQEDARQHLLDLGDRVALLARQEHGGVQPPRHHEHFHPR